MTTPAPKPTGNRRGRPRKGEIRFPTAGGLYQAKWRAQQKAAFGEEYYLIQAGYQRLWHLAHPGAKKESCKGYLQREASAAWAKENGFRATVSL